MDYIVRLTTAESEASIADVLQPARCELHLAQAHPGFGDALMELLGGAMGILSVDVSEAGVMTVHVNADQFESLCTSLMPMCYRAQRMAAHKTGP